MFYNNATLIGRIGKLSSRQINRGEEKITVTDINLGVSRSYKNSDGERDTDWVRVQAFDKLGDIVKDYGSVGRLILVEGEIRVSQYDREMDFSLEDGTVITADVPTISVSINASSIRFLDSSNSEDEDSKKATARVAKAKGAKKQTAKPAASSDDQMLPAAEGAIPF